MRGGGRRRGMKRGGVPMHEKKCGNVDREKNIALYFKHFKPGTISFRLKMVSIVT